MSIRMLRREPRASVFPCASPGAPDRVGPSARAWHRAMLQGACRAHVPRAHGWGQPEMARRSGWC